MPATMDIRRSADRSVTTTSWLTSRHSFSFGGHYQPDNTHFGLLLANNDDTVAPGTGFDTHPHRDMEILTWVVEGELTHRDSVGNHGVIHPGLVQRMSAGSGIVHSEKNGSPAQPVHFVQMWVVPDRIGITPGYQQRDVGDQLGTGALVTIASGIPGRDGVITVHNQGAALHCARLGSGDTVDLPVAPFLHVFVVRGSLTVEDAGAVWAGDAVRFTDTDGRRLTAQQPAEVLVWEMHAKLGG